MIEQLDVLIRWTPFLAGGFAWNIIITVLAALIGTIIGAGLAMMRHSTTVVLSRTGVVAPTFFRSTPTLVLMFYLATLIPDQVSLFDGDLLISIPNWFKATLAMTASQIGFNSMNIYNAVSDWRAGARTSAMLIIPNWLGAFLITLLSSSGASLVGVSELVSRVNTVIKAEGADYTIALYLYAISFFLLSGWFFISLIKTATSKLSAQYPVASTEV